MTSIKYMPVLNENGVKQGVYGVGRDICHLRGVTRFKGLLGVNLKRGVFLVADRRIFLKEFSGKRCLEEKKGVFFGWVRGSLRCTV